MFVVVVVVAACSPASQWGAGRNMLSCVRLASHTSFCVLVHGSGVFSFGQLTRQGRSSVSSTFSGIMSPRVFDTR